MRFFHLLWLFILWLNMDKSLQQNEVTCPNQKHQDVHHWNVDWWQRITLGDTASYWCKLGYKKTDGADKLTCTRDGWSPDPPCQEIKCDRMVFPNADISNNYKQEYRKNEEAHYVCRGGQSRFTLTCTANDWVGQPTCEEITCDKPEIENGYVIGEIQTYKEDDILDFACNPKYKPSEERNSKCIKLGNTANWSPTPACEPVRCELTLPALKGTTYDPAYRSFFPPGATVRVICGEKYGITTRQNTSAVSTCQDNGQWDIRPICHEVTCPNQKHQDVSYWNVYWRQRITLYDTASYRCRSGYKQTDGANRLTCTRDGWSPDPPCQELLGCGTPPFLANGDIKYTIKSQYSHNERVEYMCQSHYTMEGEPHKTCINGEWTGQMRCLKPCILNEDDTRQHNITLKSSDNKYFHHDEIIEFRCARGVPVGEVALSQRCNGGVVLLPTCQ